MRRKFWKFDLNKYLYFITSLKKFRHTPGDKTQNKKQQQQKQQQQKNRNR